MPFPKVAKETLSQMIHRERSFTVSTPMSLDLLVPRDECVSLRCCC